MWLTGHGVWRLRDVGTDSVGDRVLDEVKIGMGSLCGAVCLVVGDVADRVILGLGFLDRCVVV